MPEPGHLGRIGRVQGPGEVLGVRGFEVEQDPPALLFPAHTTGGRVDVVLLEEQL